MGQVNSVENNNRRYSVIVPNSAKAAVHGPIHHSSVGYKPVCEIDGVKTGHENFDYGVRLNPNGPCLGYRPIENGNAKPFVWSTYSEVQERRMNFGSGLMKLGMVPELSCKMRLLGIYLTNSPSWVIAELGAYAYNVTIVSLYDSVGSDAVGFILDQTKLTTLVCSSKEINVMIESIPKCPALRNIIVIDSLNEEQEAKLTVLGVTVTTMAEVERQGKENPVPASPPTADSIACFCYTSGTTGNPKGALISHKNLVADYGGIFETLGLQFTPSDIHLSYLPLPHMFEQIVQFGLFHGGSAVGFYQGNPLKIFEDVKELRPTVFPSVPRLLNRLHDRILQGVKEQGGVKEMIFTKALLAKIEGLKTGTREHAIWDPFVFNKLKVSLGLDRCRVIITGSAPISDSVMNVLRCIFCPVQEGYGQTEATAAATGTKADDFSTGHVGGPIACGEIMLADVPEMGYLSTDTQHGVGSENPIECLGRGEVCFRGPHVFPGYFNLPETTAEAIDSEGWLHSGDIGLWLPNGALKIIDRKKNIFKLAQGEYVAPDKLENIFNGVDLIAQSFVHGDSLQSRLVAIVVPDQDVLKKWATANSIEGDIDSLCENEKVKKEILKKMEERGKQFKLAGFEMVKAVYLEPKVWGLDSGLLTPTFKLKRNVAREKYRKHIDDLYKSISE